MYMCIYIYIYIHDITYRTTLQPSLQYESAWNQNPPKLLCLEKERSSVTKAISLWLKKKAKRRQTKAIAVVAAIKTGTFRPEILWHIDKGSKNLAHVLLQFVAICINLYQFVAYTVINRCQQAWEGTNDASSSSRMKGTSLQQLRPDSTNPRTQTEQSTTAVTMPKAAPHLIGHWRLQHKQTLTSQ